MNIRKFRNEIIVYAALMAATVELVSLAVIGPDLMFLRGIVIGSAVSILGFVILANTVKLLMASRMTFAIITAYIMQMALYALSFFICAKMSLAAAAGCGCGFLTLHAGIIVLYVIVYPLIKKKKNPLNDWVGHKEWNDLSEYDDKEEYDF